jgi:hypothetical protein
MCRSWGTEEMALKKVKKIGKKDVSIIEACRRKGRIFF